jgi:hypothetical protein
MKLKAQNNTGTPTPTQNNPPMHPIALESYKPSRAYDKYDEDDDDDDDEAASDVEMVGPEEPSPNFTTAPAAHPQQISMSPPLPPQASRQRQDSYSSVSASTARRHYSYIGSSTTSPAFGPQTYEYAASNASANSTLTSPALPPQHDRDLDQEATAALLMLNTDRRGTNGSVNGRGMSVKDLLTT